MGRSCFFKALLVLVLLVFSFSHGYGGRILIRRVQTGVSSVQAEETPGKSRMMVEMMDYHDPGPNTNPRTGFGYGPSPHG